jgi:NAD-dependent SIR2 family protein deacetylase
MAYDKSVFILGAGASVPAGAPVLNDFLKKARELLDNPNSPLDSDEKDIFRRVFEWRGRMYPALRFLKLDLENMENLFCLVDMAYQLGIEVTEDVRNNLIRLIARTLDLTVKFSTLRISAKKQEETYSSDPTYYEFIELLKVWHSKNDVVKTEFDSIITLNYDICCEQALISQEVPFTYGDPWSDPNKIGYKLLKLHGSINWVICQECKDTKADLDFNYNIIPIRRTGYSHIGIAERIFKPQYSTQCKECGQDLSLFIVPPTWNKVTYSEKLKSVWKSASEEIEQATRLIIIGYSLPETDSFFKYLLALGLSKNESLQEIILINPAQGQEGETLENRYRDFIAPFFDNRNFKFWRVGFQDGIQLLKIRNDNPMMFKTVLQQYEEEARNQ